MMAISSGVFGLKALVGNKVSSQSKMVNYVDLELLREFFDEGFQTPAYASLLRYLFRGAICSLFLRSVIGA